jgi:hypothetical protein
MPYTSIAALAFVSAGWPLLTRGLTWFGDVNRDMLQYVMDAHRLVEQPATQAPNPDVWLSQSDWSSYFIIYSLLGVRSGSQLLLAWLISVTGENGLAVYMPLLVALHVTLIAAATGLISTPHRRARLIAATLMACSAMLSVGLLTQLIGQVLGLTVFILSCILFMSPFYRLAPRALLRFTLLAAMVTASFFLSYPEVLPLFVASFLVYHCVGSRDIGGFLAPASKTVALATVCACILIAPDVLSVAFFFFYQLQTATAMNYPEIFPYFLRLAGIPALWGFTSYAAADSRSFDAAFLAGAVLGVAGLAGTFWLTWHREPAATTLAVMTVLIPYFLFSNNGFAIFKLAMYAQPFLLSTVVLSACLLTRVSR